MGWLSSILNPPSRNLAAAYDIMTDDAAWIRRGNSDVLGGKRPAAGVNVDYHTALNCAAALACTRAISETLATLPKLVFQNLPDETRRKARENPMWRLLHDKPNPDMDSVTFFGMQTKRLVNRGNAFSLIEYNQREEPIALWPIHNSRIKPWRRPYEFLPNGMRRGGELFYRLFPTDDPNDDMDVEPKYILNVVGFDSEDGVTACGVVPRAREEIALDTAAQEFSGSIYGNGAMPLGVVKHPGFIQDETVRNNFRNDINTLHRGRENWNKVAVLWQGASWEKLGFSPEEAQSLSGRVLTAKIICQYYGVPPGIVQIFDDYKFSTVEAMLKHFIMLCIRPYAVRWEQAIGTQLLSDMPDNVFLEFALEGLLRGDPLAQAQANALMRQWGVLSANEWRGQFNWNPVENGDKQIVPMNYTTLEKVGTFAPKSSKESPANFDPQTLARSVAATMIGTGHRTKPKKNPSSKVRAFALRVISKEITKMANKEKSAVLRAVKTSSTFLNWLGEYHDRFQGTLADAISVGVQGYFALNDAESAVMCSEIAGKYVSASKDKLLAACECQPDDLERSVSAAMETWPPFEIQDHLKKGIPNAA